MRIYCTSVAESERVKEIEKLVKSLFPEYNVVVIPNRYATEKGKAAVKAYRKEYYMKNRDRILKEKRERDQRKREEKKMKIIEENLKLTDKNEYER